MGCGVSFHGDQCECSGEPSWEELAPCDREATPEPVDDEETEKIPAQTMAELIEESEKGGKR